MKGDQPLLTSPSLERLCPLLERVPTLVLLLVFFGLWEADEVRIPFPRKRNVALDSFGAFLFRFCWGLSVVPLSLTGF